MWETLNADTYMYVGVNWWGEKGRILQTIFSPFCLKIFLLCHGGEFNLSLVYKGGRNVGPLTFLTFLFWTFLYHLLNFIWKPFCEVFCKINWWLPVDSELNVSPTNYHIYHQEILKDWNVSCGRSTASLDSTQIKKARVKKSLCIA